MRRYVFGSAILALTAMACGREGTPTAPTAPTAPSRVTVMNAIGTDPVSGATIETNQDDYVPGEVVHVVGRHWAPNEIVRLHLSEQPDNHPDVTVDVQADSAGAFSIHFYDVQDHDWGVTFTLVATGLSSGSRATATFTDGRTITSVQRTPHPAPPGAQVALVVTAHLDADVGATTWNSTGWTIMNSLGQVVGSACVDTPDHDLGDGHPEAAHIASFDITAPTQVAIFTLAVAAHSSGDCSDAISDNLAVALIVSTPTNSPPVVSAGGPYAGAEGSGIPLNGASASDANGDHLTYGWAYAAGSGVDAGASCSFSDASAIDPLVTCTDDGPYTLTLTVSDGHNAAVVMNATLDVTNVAPTVVIAPASQSVNEGGSVAFTATIADPGANDVLGSFAWAASAVSCTPAAGSTATTATFDCNDSGNGLVTLDVADDDGGAAQAQSSVHVTNVAPSISAIVLSPVSEGNVYSASQPVTVTTSFIDPGAADQHICMATAVTVNNSSTAFGPAAANAATCLNVLEGLPEGVYNVTITVTDKDGGSDAETVQVVVFEPVFSGFVTGGGWFNSPAGAYSGNPSATGKASFGFVSKYQKGVPTGSTQFVFHIAGFNFRSTTYDFLLVNQGGSNAQFKGTGTVNGVAGYSFMVWATDGSPDNFRIKIWDSTTGATVYDNGSDGQVQGSIVIHVPK